MNGKIKRRLTAVLAGLMLLSAASCGGGEEENRDSAGTDSVSVSESGTTLTDDGTESGSPGLSALVSPERFVPPASGGEPTEADRTALSAVGKALFNGGAVFSLVLNGEKIGAEEGLEVTGGEGELTVILDDTLSLRITSREERESAALVLRAELRNLGDGKLTVSDIRWQNALTLLEKTLWLGCLTEEEEGLGFRRVPLRPGMEIALRGGRGGVLPGFTVTGEGYGLIAMQSAASGEAVLRASYSSAGAGKAPNVRLAVDLGFGEDSLTLDGGESCLAAEIVLIAYAPDADLIHIASLFAGRPGGGDRAD